LIGDYYLLLSNKIEKDRFFVLARLI